jgi:hydroxymethylpyrimidine pyrophosphatase-like HAD family hydrolase
MKKLKNKKVNQILEFEDDFGDEMDIYRNSNLEFECDFEDKFEERMSFEWNKEAVEFE